MAPLSAGASDNTSGSLTRDSEVSDTTSDSVDSDDTAVLSSRAGSETGSSACDSLPRVDLGIASTIGKSIKSGACSINTSPAGGWTDGIKPSPLMLGSNSPNNAWILLITSPDLAFTLGL